ncbi:MAG: hypothetical protein J5636_03400 [Clostridiales bacterium]|nr:hypothetical protein [Clostridiales bacterium]
MLGDELKKSLEPIQTSDELLAKTRAAIEKARLEQAAASLNDTSSVSRKASPRMSYFLKAAVPLACLVLVVGGLALLIPKFSKSSDSTMKNKRSKNAAAQAEATAVYEAADTVADHNYEIDNVSDLIDGEANSGKDYDDDNKSESAETTTTEDRTSEASETQNDVIESEETIDGNSKNYLGPTLEVAISDERMADIGDYLICISEDGKSLFLIDKVTGDIVSDSEEHRMPVIEGLEESETITGLSFNDDAKMLYITITDSEGKQKLYAVTVIDGSSEGFTPILVQDN